MQARDKITPVHTLQTIFRCKSAYNLCLCTVGGNQGTKEKPPKHRECTQGGGENRPHNLGSAKHYVIVSPGVNNKFFAQVLKIQDSFR